MIINYSYKKQCEGKQAHSAEAKAQAAIRSLSRFTQSAYTAYHCLYCKQWHVGHRPPTQWERTHPHSQS